MDKIITIIVLGVFFFIIKLIAASVHRMRLTPEEKANADRADELENVLIQNDDLPDEVKELLRDYLWKGVDVFPYINKDFNTEQLTEIFEGIKAGFDVSSYASPDIDAQKMRQIRYSLKEDKNDESPSE